MLLIKAIKLYSYVIIVYILLSWLPNVQSSSFGQMLGKIVEPYLEPFRKIIPPLGMIDISPIVAILALNLAQQGVIVLSTYF